MCKDSEFNLKQQKNREELCAFHNLFDVLNDFFYPLYARSMISLGDVSLKSGRYSKAPRPRIRFPHN